MSDKTKMYLLRHGQTVWDTERRLQGHKDSALTDTCREQACQNGLKLRELVGSLQIRFVSSPLGRCRETTQLVAGMIGLDLSRIEYDDRVKELSYGHWEGRKVVEVRVNDALAFQSRLANRWDIPAPGGKSYSMVAERLKHWLQEVEGQTMVLVSHGCAGRILRGIYSGLSKEETYTLEELHDAILC